VRGQERFADAIACGREQFERPAAVGLGADGKAGECGIREREHAPVYPNARSGGGGPQSKTNACGVVGRGKRRAVRAERAVRQSGKFPNAHVAPLRAGRQCKPLWPKEMG
jgi:hypothetical protein